MAHRLTCSAASAAAGETVAGKAPAARYWVLLEKSLPWPERAEEAAPADLLRQVKQLGSARFGLIRRPGSRSGGGTVVVADTLEAVVAAGPAAGADLPAMLSRARPGEHLFLVCTHARRDRCCGRLGAPAAAAVAAAFPELTWETSHVGGHRLAANLVCLPHGYVFSRLTANSAVEAARAYTEGRLDLDHCRGRSGLDAVSQAGEVLARRLAGSDALDVAVDPVPVRRLVISSSELTSCSGERGELVNYEPAI